MFSFAVTAMRLPTVSRTRWAISRTVNRDLFSMLPPYSSPPG